LEPQLGIRINPSPYPRKLQLPYKAIGIPMAHIGTENVTAAIQILHPVDLLIQWTKRRSTIATKTKNTARPKLPLLAR
jgi:hypothetical protein